MEGITVPLTIPQDAIVRALEAVAHSREQRPVEPTAFTLSGSPNGKAGVPRIQARALSELWAMREPELATVLTIIARRNEGDPRAVEARIGTPLAGTRDSYVRGSTAVIPVHGPLARRHMGMLGDISGGGSLESIREDFTVALADPAIGSILLDVDSPGGSVLGTNELAETIYAARGQKPIVAYVGGLGASAAYWIASAADSIIADRVAVIGSIGVLAIVAAQPDDGTMVFVSSQSPNKVLEPDTEKGQASIMRQIDASAAVFIATVARNRGMGEEAIVEAAEFGDIVLGDTAAERGLIDSVGSFQSALAEVQARASSPVARTAPTGAKRQATLPGTAPGTTPQARSGNPVRLEASGTQARQKIAVAAQSAVDTAVAAIARRARLGGNMEEDRQPVEDTQEEAPVEDTDEGAVETPELLDGVSAIPNRELAALREQAAKGERESDDLRQRLGAAEALVAKMGGDLAASQEAALRAEVREIVSGGASGMRWQGDLEANIDMVVEMRGKLGADSTAYQRFIAAQNAAATHLHEKVLGQVGTDLQPAALGGAKEQLEAMGADLQQKQPTKFKSYESGMAEAMRLRPDLRAQFGRESELAKRQRPAPQRRPEGTRRAQTAAV